MSSNYSANQFEDAFRPRRMQLWTVSKSASKRPAARMGHTTFIADDRGHLLPGAEKKDSAWPDFKGTWALPNRIPAHHVNPTSRSADGLKQLRSWGLQPQPTGRSPSQTDTRCSDEEQDDGQREDVSESQTDTLSSEDGAGGSSTQPEFQDSPLREESSSLSSYGSKDRQTSD